MANLDDIARAAGVSASTVSRVLNGTAPISEETRRRVLQAAGRVIRTETDRGVVLLIDTRYRQEKYRALMPPHWEVRDVKKMSELNNALRKFWGVDEKGE